MTPLMKVLMQKNQQACLDFKSLLIPLKLSLEINFLFAENWPSYLLIHCAIAPGPCSVHRIIIMKVAWNTHRYFPLKCFQKTSLCYEECIC